MTSTTRALWLTAVASLGLATSAAAQAPYQPRLFAPVQPQTRPTYSPYLNLARPGNAAVNYYGLVRPELEFRAAIGSMRQQLGTLAQEVAAPEEPLTMPATGHPVQFLNYSRYFMNLGAGRPGQPAAAGRPAGAAGQTARPAGPAAGAGRTTGTGRP
jgi:hypothetical protein